MIVRGRRCLFSLQEADDGVNISESAPAKSKLKWNLNVKNIYFYIYCCRTYSAGKLTFSHVLCPQTLLPDLQCGDLIQSFPNTMHGYRRLSLAALAVRLANKQDCILTLLPNTHYVISVQFLSPISSNVSSVRTWRRRLAFLFFTESVSLNLLACLLIVGLAQVVLETWLEICVVFQNMTFCFSYTYCEYTDIYTMRIPV